MTFSETVTYQSVPRNTMLSDGQLHYILKYMSLGSVATISDKNAQNIILKVSNQCCVIMLWNLEMCIGIYMFVSGVIATIRCK